MDVTFSMLVLEIFLQWPAIFELKKWVATKE